MFRRKRQFKEFVAQVLEGSMTIGRDADQMITARVAQIDHLISIQLNEVLHHPQFQKLSVSDIPGYGYAIPAGWRFHIPSPRRPTLHEFRQAAESYGMNLYPRPCIVTR